MVFVSDPLPGATEMSGLFSGHLDLITNKKDFDFVVGLYEWRTDGTYRAAAAVPGARELCGRPHAAAGCSRRASAQRLDFTSLRLASHLCAAGSRLVLVLGILKSPEPADQLRHGKDVSDETIADAGEPLTIRLFNRSAIDLPVRRSEASPK